MSAHGGAQSSGEAPWPAANPKPEVLEFARAYAAAHAQKADSSSSDLASLMSHFGGHDLLGLDLDAVGNSAARAEVDLRLQSRSIAGAAMFLETIAGECMSSAFSLWAHRMVLEYLRAVTPESRLGLARAQLLAGERPGSTAMAAALQEAAGLGQVPIQATPEGNGWNLTGVIRWASNLQSNGFVVLPARVGDTDQRIVVGIDLDREGVTVHPSKELLALNSTSSGAVELTSVSVAADEVITSDIKSFLKRVRPVLLLLQTAFCLGLARRSLQEVTSLVKGPAEVLRESFSALYGEFNDASARATRAQNDPSSISYWEVTQLRLDASHVAQGAAQLESTLMGGRGYQRASDSCRRLREAMFLPVQSPSEVQLQWELQL